MITEENLLSGLTLHGPKCLRFPNAVLERIFAMLPTQRDLRETCVVHRSWTMAALNVLWREPQFAGPVAFRGFLEAIHKNKQTALRVRTLNLCLSPVEQQHRFGKSGFRASMRVIQQSHVNHAQCPLASPQIIFAVLQQCEMVDTLSLYGWHLQSTHLRLIASYLPRLKSICIIGSLQGSSSQQSTMVPLLPPSVTHIELHGSYFLHPPRYPALNVLRLSIPNTAQTSNIERFLQGGLTTLQELTLSDATDIRDDHLCQLFDAYPNLHSFSLEDSRDITGQGIVMAIKNARFLTDLLIRQHPDAPKNQPIYQQYDHMAPMHMTCRLRSMTLTQLDIDDHQLCQILEPSLSHIQHIYLTNCPYITNQITARVFQHASRLESLTIIHCKGVGPKTLNILQDSPAAHSLHLLSFIGNGKTIQPADLLNFVRSAASHHLQQLVLRGYGNMLSTPFIARHARIYRHSRSTMDTMEFDREGILRLAKEGYIPEDRMVTGKELVELANALNMEMSQLEAIMDGIKKKSRKQQEQQEEPSHNPLATMTNSEESSSDHLQSATTSHAPALEGTRHAILDIESSEETDPTSYTSPEPASTCEEDDEHESITKHLDNNAIVVQQQHEEKTSPSDDSINQYGESTMVSSGSGGDLGGWGSTLDISWQSSRSSFGSRSTSDTSSHGSSSANYEHAWRQVAKEAPIITGKRVPMADDMFPDGWGTPKQVVQWEDARLAYAHDVVEKQKSTTFWIKRDDGGWIKAADEPAATTAATTATTTTATASNTPRPHRTRTESSKHTHSRSNKRASNTETQRRNPSEISIEEGSEVSARWIDFAAGRPGSQQIPDLINLGSKEDALFSFSPTTPIPTSSKSLQPVSSSASASFPKLSQLHHAKDDLDELLH